MNTLHPEQRIQILTQLVEGSSIRSTERITRTHRDTIMSLLVSAGEKCEAFLDERMRNLPSDHWQIDEIWTFCRKKEARLTPEEKETGLWGDHSSILSCRSASNDYKLIEINLL
jgi:hypothetical protein